MRNIVNPFIGSPRRIEIVRGLISRMDADIVAPNGTLPDITIEEFERLMSGGEIYISVPNSEKCFLETDSDDIKYTDDMFGPRIGYWEKRENPKKNAMKGVYYYFIVKLSGQRSRS